MTTFGEAGSVLWTVFTVTLALVAFVGIQYLLRLQQQRRRWKATRYVESLQSQVLTEVRRPERLAAIKNARSAAEAKQEFLDSICKTAASALGTPASIMTVVEEDGQGTIATWGADGRPREVGLEASFCKYVVAFRKPLVIEDATHDQLVMTNEASKQAQREGIVSYLGVPLWTDGENSEVIGTLCVFDNEQTHKWNYHDRLTLEGLADLADLDLTSST